MSQLQLLDFSGGLAVEFDSGKRDPGTLPLLINARVRRKNIEPIRSHKALNTPIYLRGQGLYAADNLLFLIADGRIYKADIQAQSNVNFVSLSGGVLSNTADTAWGCKLPETTSYQFFNGLSTDSITSKIIALNRGMTPTAKCVMFTDGVNQPIAYFPDGTLRPLGTYASWTANNPEYVPVGVCPIETGNKVYMLSPDRRQIYQSVSGRPLDFMVNVYNNAGTLTKGGDASTVAKAVSYSPITALFPADNGGFLASTLFETYLVSPDMNNTIFGEPSLNHQSILPSGIVTHGAACRVVGDVVITAQTGLQSFNIIQGLRIESNDNPFSRAIYEMLQPAQDSCASITNGNYAFFALNTILGRGVLVYDMFRERFVSFDTEFGHVKQFALVQYGNVNRLFYLTYQGEVREVGAGNSWAVTRAYIGDLLTVESSHKVTQVSLRFEPIGPGDGDLLITPFQDGHATAPSLRRLAGGDSQTSSPLPIPIKCCPTEHTDITFKPPNNFLASKSGLLLEWQAGAALVGLAGSYEMDSRPVKPGAVSVFEYEPVTETLALIPGLSWNTFLPDYAAVTAAQALGITTFIVMGSFRGAGPPSGVYELNVQYEAAIGASALRKNPVALVNGWLGILSMGYQQEALAKGLLTGAKVLVSPNGDLIPGIKTLIRSGEYYYDDSSLQTISLDYISTRNFVWLKLTRTRYGCTFTTYDRTTPTNEYRCYF